MSSLIDKIRHVGRAIPALVEAIDQLNLKLDRLYARDSHLPLGSPATSARRIHEIVTDRSKCNFYHAAELPDGTVVDAQWDLRKNIDQYLGEVDFRGKTVIEIGPASGYLSFHMEAKGANVTCVEPPMETFWDLVPNADADLAAIKTTFGEHIQRIRNSFWYFHGLKNSSIRMFEVNPYAIPNDFGSFDFGLFASVLLHCSSPVRMLESVGRHVKGTMIISEPYFEDLGDEPICRLVPSPTAGVVDTWWQFSPVFFQRFLSVMGFRKTRVIRHRQLFVLTNTWMEMFTVVGSR
jgi:hypothetical protein